MAAILPQVMMCSYYYLLKKFVLYLPSEGGVRARKMLTRSQQPQLSVLKGKFHHEDQQGTMTVFLEIKWAGNINVNASSLFRKDI